MDLNVSKPSRIVAISYAYPPLKWPRSVQVHRLLYGLAEIGHNITLLCAEPKSGFGVIDESMKSLPHHRSIEIVPVKAYYTNKLVRTVYKFIPALKKLPDEFNAWIIPAIYEGRKVIRKYGNDVVLCTFSNPWSDHIIGLYLKWKFKIPWIAHFSDPWASNPYIQWSSGIKNLQIKMENSVIEAADQVVFVSEETRTLFSEHYGYKINKKSVAISHISAPELENMRRSRPIQKRMLLTHAGDFYGPRTPKYFLQALYELKKEKNYSLVPPRVLLIGNIDPKYQLMIQEKGLQDIVEIHSPVPYIESLQYIVDSDVLILIDALSDDQSVFFPSKLVEYIGSGNPVLAMTPINGTSARVIRETGGFVVSPDDIDGIKRSLIQRIEEYNNNALFSKISLNGKYSQKNISGLFSGVVELAARGM
jgi:glycosyltransferase involved in cell wall biosynthesis